MVLGGLQKSSLIDYPGKISCVLFLSGCNFVCPYCHNPDLAKGFPGENISENSIYDFLEKRKGFLDGVVISGGEATLSKGLFDFCRRIKQIGYPIKIDTNGSRPETIQDLIDENLVDYIAMDVKTDSARYPSLVKKSEVDSIADNIVASIQTIMKSEIGYEFKTTCVKPFVDVDAIESISRLISGAKLYALQKFQNTGVLQPEFFHDHEYGYSNDELMNLKSIAKPWVKRCIVR